MRLWRHGGSILGLLALGALLASCGSDGITDPSGSDDLSQYEDYVDVRILSATGIDGVDGGYPGLGNPAPTDLDPDPNHLLVTGAAGNFFIWFVTDHGGEATLTIRTESSSRRYSSCKIPPNPADGFGMRLFGSLVVVTLPPGTIADSQLRAVCASVR
jgi:hypothetical protein